MPSAEQEHFDQDESGAPAGLAALELIHAIADTDARLAPPPLDDDADFFFESQSAASFGDSALGEAIAIQRRRNVQRQLRQLENPDYVQTARDAYEILETELQKKLVVADAKLGNGHKTKLLVSTDYNVLVTPLLLRLAWPPSHVNPELGFDDTKVATLRLLERMGMHAAKAKGFVSFIDVHPCGAHRGDPNDQTFPQGVGDSINWNSAGCSADHHKAFVEFNNAVEEFRVHNTFGETLNCGYSIPKPWHDAFLSTTQVPFVTAERLVQPPPEYLTQATPRPQDVNLHYSNDLDPSLSLHRAREEIARSEASFTFFSSSTFHPSFGLYSANFANSSSVSRILSLERAISEIRYLAAIPDNPEDLWIVTRSYLARLLHVTAKWKIPASISWCYEQLAANDLDALSWTIDDIEAKANEKIKATILHFSNAWKASGRTSIGNSKNVMGVLEEAIAGWKVLARQPLEVHPYPVLARLDPNAALHVPAVTHDGRFASTTQADYRDTYRFETPFPLLSRSRHTHPIVAPVMNIDGRVVTIDYVDKCTQATSYDACPSVHPAAILPAPAATPDGRFVTLSSLAFAQRKRRKGVLTLERCLDADDDLGDVAQGELEEFTKTMSWSVPKKTRNNINTFRQAMHDFATGQKTVVARKRVAQNSRGLTMARLLDPNDDLKDVIGPEAVKFAKDQGWVLTKTGQTRDGAVNSIRNTARLIAQGNPPPVAFVKTRDPTIARFLDSTDDLEEIVKPRIESYRRKHDIFTDWRMMTLTKPKVVAESRNLFINLVGRKFAELLDVLSRTVASSSSRTPSAAVLPVAGLATSGNLQDPAVVAFLNEPVFAEILHDQHFADLLQRGQYDALFSRYVSQSVLAPHIPADAANAGVDSLKLLLSQLISLFS